MASTEALKTPGAKGVSTSAMTARWISVSVMPTSSALGLAVPVAAPATVNEAPISAMTVTTDVTRTREIRTVPPSTPPDYRPTSRYNIPENGGLWLQPARAARNTSTTGFGSQFSSQSPPKPPGGDTFRCGGESMFRNQTNGTPVPSKAS